MINLAVGDLGKYIKKCTKIFHYEGFFTKLKNYL